MIYTMSVTQTVDIPADRRLTIDVPREVPTGRTILTFTPAYEQESPGQKPAKRKMTVEEEKEYISHNAEWLNREMEDVLLYQNLDAFEEDLERLTPQELAVLHKAVVPFSRADIVLDRDASTERLDS